LPAVSLERLDISGDLLRSGLQACLDHLGCLQVVTIDGDGLRYKRDPGRRWPRQCPP